MMKEKDGLNAKVPRLITGGLFANRCESGKLEDYFFFFLAAFFFVAFFLVAFFLVAFLAAFFAFAIVFSFWMLWLVKLNK